MPETTHSAEICFVTAVEPAVAQTTPDWPPRHAHGPDTAGLRVRHTGLAACPLPGHQDDAPGAARQLHLADAAVPRAGVSPVRVGPAQTRLRDTPVRGLQRRLPRHALCALRRPPRRVRPGDGRAVAARVHRAARAAGGVRRRGAPADAVVHARRPTAARRARRRGVRPRLTAGDGTVPGVARHRPWPPADDAPAVDGPRPPSRGTDRRVRRDGTEHLPLSRTVALVPGPCLGGRQASHDR